MRSIKFIKPSVKVLNHSKSLNNSLYDIWNHRNELSLLGITDILDKDFITLEIQCNRLQSLLLCELRDSYSVQSQRYCRYDDIDSMPVIFSNMNKLNFFSNVNFNDQKIYELILTAYQLYEKMSELKPESKDKTKFTKDDFTYGVPIEDARYILPTCCITNKVMTIEGHNIIEFLWCLIKNAAVMIDILDAFFKEIPMFQPIVDAFFKDNKKVLMPMLEFDENEFSLKSNNLDISGAAALTCTNKKMPSELLKRDNLDKVAYRVAEMNHTSILEHTKIEIKTQLSIAAYNQLVRHRHQRIVHDDFYFIINNLDRLDYENEINVNKGIIIPDSMKALKTTNYEYYCELEKLIKMYINLFDSVAGELKHSNVLSSNKKNINQFEAALIVSQILPMGTKLNLLINTNLSNELYVSERRSCMKAQWELRNYTHKKIKEMRKVFNNSKIIDRCLPPCLKDGCKEGRECCGKTEEVKKILIED